MDNLIIFGAKYLIFIIAAVTLAVWLQIKGKTQWQFAAAVIIAGITAVILSKLASSLYYHQRPFAVQNIQPLVSHSGDNSFPSDHTIMATTLGMVIYFYHRRLGMYVLVLALIVGIARVAAHVHWPVDIAGGLVLGAVSGWVGYFLAKKLLLAPGGKKTAVDQQDN
ncbi:hypothetical protein BVY00_01560 [bacterium G20]|nr:hypothetical protein BVY00_01560 [bacterium G20]